MIGIYFLVSILTQFAPQNLWLLDQSPSEISVEFQDIKNMKIGAAVLAEGELIGSVSEINTLDKSSTGLPTAALGKDSFEVKIKIAPHHRALLKRGTIALIKTPYSISRSTPEIVVELLIPQNASSPNLRDGEILVGYSSFEEFWSADFSKRGIDNNAFQIG